MATRPARRILLRPAAPARSQGNPRARRHRLRGFGMLLLTLIILRGSFIMPPQAFDLRVAAISAPYNFDLASWEIDTLMAKLRDTVRSPVAGTPGLEQAALVRAYFDNVTRLDELDGQLKRLVSEGKSDDPQVAALSVQAAALRRQQDYWRPQVEATMEGQVGELLRGERLLTAGALWPPLRFHFAELPLYLIVSPRERIARSLGAYLQPGVPVAAWSDIEDRVTLAGRNVDGAGVSALVDQIGGFSTWPTMVIDQSSLGWSLNTVAHEWTHTYLVFYPLGWHYFDSGDMTTINETVASIVGEEAGGKARDTYYPPAPPAPASPAPWPRQAAPALAFDFGAAMRATRLGVDGLLAGGFIPEAEAFMEARRQVFVDNGYALRKLNQAYFAFHGSYATSPGAVSPIGPKLQALRQRSTSLAAFLHTVRGFTAVQDLDDALAR